MIFIKSQLLTFFTLASLFFSSNSGADILDNIPEVSTASQGLALIQKDSFGGIKLAWLLEQKNSIDLSERVFGPDMGNGHHGVSLIESFGRITLHYVMSIESKTPNPETVFDLSEEKIIDHFSKLGVGDWSASYKVMFKKYKWNWKSGDFKCEAFYDFWEPDSPFLNYKCFSSN